VEVAATEATSPEARVVAALRAQLEVDAINNKAAAFEVWLGPQLFCHPVT
jgi:hypothetical protein